MQDLIGAIDPQGELLPFQALQGSMEGVRSAPYPWLHCSLVPVQSH